MTSVALSEGLTLLNRPHAGPGTFVHRESYGAFVHLYVAEALDMAADHAERVDAVVVEQREDDTLRVTVGQGATAIKLTLNPPKEVKCPRCVVPNLWVDAGDEVWISSSHPGRYLAYGCATKRPLRE